jgi:Acetyltransferase (GNAT) domain
MDNVVLTSIPDDSTAAAWNDCLDNSQFAGLYMAPDFFRVPYFKNQGPFAVLAVRDSVVHGVVTGLFVGRDVECGHSGSPQICVRTGSDLELVGKALATGLKSLSRSTAKFISAFAWNEVPGFRAAGFRIKKFEIPLGTIVLDLSRSTDLLFREFAESRRHNIRRVIKAGVEVTEMNIDRDFDDYYALYKHWSEFKGLSLQPYDMQRAVFESRSNRLLLVARHDGRMVGVSTFRFRQPNLIEYMANVSRREETKLKQNDLLMWRAIEWASQQKDIRYFSMAAAHTFLQRFGGLRHPTYRYSLDLTTFRRRDLAEKSRAVALRMYHALPQRARERLKKLLKVDRDVNS